MGLPRVRAHGVSRAARRALVPELGSEGSELPLDDTTSHHLLRVLRLAPGDPVVVFDGQGKEAEARLVADPHGTVRLVQTAPPRSRRATQAVHVILGLLKGPAMDDAVRMATEAGMTDLHPLVAARSVARDGRDERWLRIAESAAVQCGRADLPRIHPAGTLPAILDRIPPHVARRIALPGAARRAPTARDVAVLVGPEGGLTPAEVEQALARGFEPVTLGPWVLRACTAAPVAVALVTAPSDEPDDPGEGAS